MNEKMMLAQDPNASPYPGYEKAKLTIGTRDAGFGFIYYGFGSGTSFGNLIPKNSYVGLSIFTNDPLGAVPTVFATHPFYFQGKKYEDQSNASDIVDDWKTKVGQTVDVFIQKSGGGRKHLPLRACNSLWRVAA